MKIATWNVNGIRAREDEFLTWIEREKPDALCLREIKAAPDQLSLLLSKVPGGKAVQRPGGVQGFVRRVGSARDGHAPCRIRRRRGRIRQLQKRGPLVVAHRSCQMVA
jgi:hypothetical protein